MVRVAVFSKDEEVGKALRGQITAILTANGMIVIEVPCVKYDASEVNTAHVEIVGRKEELKRAKPLLAKAQTRFPFFLIPCLD